MKGYARDPVCLVPKQGPDEFVRLPLNPPMVLDREACRFRPSPMKHGENVITLDGRTFRKSGQRTQGGWLIYREK
jgi:hypothetical protein